MKRKKLESIEVSKQFLKELLTPFAQMPNGKISDFVVDGDTDRVRIYFCKEGGVSNTS